MLLALLWNLVACSRGEPGRAGINKREGPELKGLSLEQLQAIDATCRTYGSTEDPRVIYTSQYCADALIATLNAGYTRRSSAKVDPTLPPLH
jgi:hypothetical protein